MQSNFELCLKKMLAHEGGYVDHKLDPGGMTNLGVTKRVWEEWVGHDVDEKQMRALTPETVAPLYKRKYWDACRADDLVGGVDYCVFDVAVNYDGFAAKDCLHFFQERCQADKVGCLCSVRCVIKLTMICMGKFF